jgi:hypothetical protein
LRVATHKLLQVVGDLEVVRGNQAAGDEQARVGCFSCQCRVT